MSADDALPESDRLAGAPHPRETTALFGQDEAERTLLDAYRSGKMHHAWILGGAEGIGKATLAYRFTRFILAHPRPDDPAVREAASLAVDPGHPAARQVANMAHPDLLVLRRQWEADKKRISSGIRADMARRVVPFFGSTAGQGGWRICIVDSAEDLNSQSANALLKTLEEPPPNALFLILANRPRRLLPTIRSRCRMLMLAPLAEEDILRAIHALDLENMPEDAALREAAKLADGSVRRALDIASGGSAALRAAMAGLLAEWPRFNGLAVHALAEQVDRAGDEGVAAIMDMALDWIHERALEDAARGGARLAAWPELWEKTVRDAREAGIYNLDRKPLVLNLFFDLARIPA